MKLGLRLVDLVDAGEFICRKINIIRRSAYGLPVIWPNIRPTIFMWANSLPKHVEIFN